MESERVTLSCGCTLVIEDDCAKLEQEIMSCGGCVLGHIPEICTMTGRVASYFQNSEEYDYILSDDEEQQ